MEQIKHLRRLSRELLRMTTVTVLLMALALSNAVLERKGAAFMGPRLTTGCLLLALAGIGCIWLMSIFVNGHVKRLAQGEAQENGGQQ